MELRQLKTFITIVDKGSYVQAAEFLGYTQPTLTAHIQALESELGTNLFDRLGQRIRLTREGEHFLVYAERILTLVAEATASVTSERQANSRIIIGVSETFSVIHLPLLLKAFRQQHPAVSIELRFGDLAKFYNDLRNNSIDLAFLLADASQLPSITTEILRPEPMSLIASPEHPLSRARTIALADLTAETFIVTQEGCAYRNFIETLLEKNSIAPKAYMKVKNIEAIKQFVVSGLGLALLPTIYLERELASGLLVELPWQLPDPGLFTQLAYHKDKWFPPIAVSFIELARQALTQVVPVKEARA
jgi:DNA-binding transcriptional LysR family regulator